MSKINNICGIECEFTKLSDVWEFFRILGSEFESIMCYFDVVDASIFSKGKRICLPDRLNSHYFQNLIEQSIVCERLVLHLLPLKISPKEINTYEDFIQSDCEMIVLLYDCYYLEIYCKRELWTQNLFCALKKLPQISIQIKHRDTDTRTVMYV